MFDEIMVANGNSASKPTAEWTMRIRVSLAKNPSQQRREKIVETEHLGVLNSRLSV